MNKRTLLALLFALAIITNCKKSTTPANQVSIIGTWTLNSETELINSVTSTYSATNIPCMAETQLVIKAGGTFEQTYSGTDTCYIYKTANTSETDGFPGVTVKGTWVQNGNNFVLTFNYATASPSANVTVTTVGSTTELLLSVSVTGPLPFSNTQTFIK